MSDRFNQINNIRFVYLGHEEILLRKDWILFPLHWLGSFVLLFHGRCVQPFLKPVECFRQRSDLPCPLFRLFLLFLFLLLDDAEQFIDLWSKNFFAFLGYLLDDQVEETESLQNLERLTLSVELAQDNETAHQFILKFEVSHSADEGSDLERVEVLEGVVEEGKFSEFLFLQPILLRS